MIRILSVLSVLAISFSSCFAFELGETILVTGKGELKVDGHATGRVYAGMALKIAAIKGDEVWLNNGGVGGWFPTKSIVTAEKGFAYCLEDDRQKPSKSVVVFGTGDALDANQALR
ncbi:MAG TPA: hypothetical protein VGG64_26475 [Pirellulales bacterium]|jgi:hypothetical protein